MRDLSNETIVQVEIGKVRLLQFRKLQEEKSKLFHGYTMKPLDFRKDQFEPSLQTLQNAQIVKGLWIKTAQTHSENIRIIRESETVESVLENTDGVITNQKGLTFLTSYADCTPILIYDPVQEVIANVHSGWRGTVKKIGKKALTLMIQEFGTKPEDCIVTIGPNIGKCCFEVEKEVAALFSKTFSQYKCWKTACREIGQNKYKIDTSKINREGLEQMGVLPEKIQESKICTKCENQELHSYRAEKEASGRSVMITRLEGGN